MQLSKQFGVPASEFPTRHSLTQDARVAHPLVPAGLPAGWSGVSQFVASSQQALEAHALQAALPSWREAAQLPPPEPPAAVPAVPPVDEPPLEPPAPPVGALLLHDGAASSTAPNPNTASKA